jgi:hypothetical protein
MKRILPKNIDATGRWIRGTIGVLLLAYAAWQMSWIALVAGLFVLFEACASWCVMYHILGINTCPVKKKK